MSLHPLTVAGMTEEESGLSLATRQMAEQPGGVRVLLVSPRNMPEVIDCTLHVTDGKVEVRPAGDTRGVAGIGEDAYAQHLGSYGLAPCPCCPGDRWRIVLPIVHNEATLKLLDVLALLVGESIKQHPERYCLRDLRALTTLRVPDPHPITTVLAAYPDVHIARRTHLFATPEGQPLRAHLLTPVALDGTQHTVRFVEIDIYHDGDGVRLAVADTTTEFGREMQGILDEKPGGIWSFYSIGMGRCQCGSHGPDKWNPAGFALLCAADTQALAVAAQQWPGIVAERQDDFCPVMLKYLKESGVM